MREIEEREPMRRCSGEQGKRWTCEASGWRDSASPSGFGKLGISSRNVKRLAEQREYH